MNYILPLPSDSKLVVKQETNVVVVSIVAVAWRHVMPAVVG
jgi:hypothetical protein